MYIAVTKELPCISAESLKYKTLLPSETLDTNIKLLRKQPSVIKTGQNSLLLSLMLSVTSHLQIKFLEMLNRNPDRWETIYLHSDNSLKSQSNFTTRCATGREGKGQALQLSSYTSVVQVLRSHSCPNPSVSSMANNNFSFSCS